MQPDISINLKKNFIQLPDGTSMPKLGQGTWHMGEDDEKYRQEIEALRFGISEGLVLLDTAEMYADGKAENIVGNAISGIERSELYLVSKVYPYNANRHRIYSSLERSLKLMGTEYLDMYLLHWRENADLSEVVYCMEDLKEQGKIRRWGVSNFDVRDMEDLMKVPDGRNCCINQVMYNLGARGIEYDLIPWQRERGIPFMAYSPVGQAGALVTDDGISKETLMTDKNVLEVAEKRGISVIQLLLAFVLRQPDIVAIPKASGFQHIRENAETVAIKLTEDELAQLSESFPAPTEKIEMEKC